MVPNIEIIIGTYEEFLLGYKLEMKNEAPVLTQSFADKSHSGAIKSLAVQGRWIASGSTDDRIFIYDMRIRKQSEILLGHEGTINCLAFTNDDTHLFSGGDDGRLIATHLGNWATSATWKKAHDGSAITHISIHPSGKLALSLGSDLVLRTWNLVKGRVAYKTNLKSRNSLGRTANCLAWSPTGDYFTLTGQRIVEIWSIQKADVVRSLKTASKPISLCWVGEETCVVGLEDGKIQWLTLDEEEKEKSFAAHESRVKDMVLHKDTLVTASSCGEIKVWQIDVSERNLSELVATNIGCRPTCIGVLDLEQFGTSYEIKKDNLAPKILPKKENKSNTQRGVVTIEYENEESEDENEEEDPKNDSEESESEDEEDDTNPTEEEDESDESEEEIKTKKRKVAVTASKKNPAKQGKIQKEKKGFPVQKSGKKKNKNKSK